jgi:RNA polymerase primary sigma factor
MAATATTSRTGGDAPLIDLNDASIKKLFARAKKRGVITYDELNEPCPRSRCPPSRSRT